MSVGNEADLGVGELVAFLAEDPETRVILLFLETIRNSAQLAGADRALDAFFRDCGILRVDMLETLVEIAPLVAGRKAPELKRPPRVAVVTTTGGGAATVVDRLGLHGIECIAPGTESPIVDLTMAATSESYGKTLHQLLAWPACDAVLAAVGSSAQFHPELAVEPIVAAQAGEKPLAAFLTPHAERSLALLAARGIAAFRTPEACADAFAAYFAWRRPRQRPVFESFSYSLQNPFELFASLGIPLVEQQIARAPDFAHSVPYPVAVKLPGVDHKTESGGVALDIVDRAAFEVQRKKLNAKEILVQKMQKGLAEAIVGYRDDPVVGPMVLVGAGGTLAELYEDFALRLAPVAEDEALEMIAEVKGLAPIRGYRNLPRGDVRALATAVSALSRLCLIKNQPVAEAEINPLIVQSGGVVAVDGLVVVKD